VISLGVLTLCTWLYLWLGHTSFWKIEHDPNPAPPEGWPSVVAIIPARNEAELIPETLRYLFAQDYPGDFRVVLVDDHSQDGTAEAAIKVAAEIGAEAEVSILTAELLPPGWTGKVWAMDQGVTRGIPAGDGSRYVLFCDADISHGVGALRELDCRAEAGPCDLVSFMVKLQCSTVSEKLMIPAFVYFFRLLYPLRKVNDPEQSLAGAAGGIMLTRREALERMGGLKSIKGEIIDDCSLAREIKRGGNRIWLGLSDNSESTRSYETMSEILRMISRTAYTQLRYSPLRLIGCVVGLGITFLAPPLLLIAGGWSAALGGMAWLVMTLLYLPMVLYYRQSPLLAATFPFTACYYLSATVLSAWLHHRGKGGEWKGRRTSEQAPQ
jgi:hopene-associated glycosyltransferase HpnB